MSRRRELMRMAGLIKTPVEKHLARQQRKLDKLQREFKQDLEYVQMIQARERGDESMKPMPFAKPKKD